MAWTFASVQVSQTHASSSKIALELYAYIVMLVIRYTHSFCIVLSWRSYLATSFIIFPFHIAKQNFSSRLTFHLYGKFSRADIWLLFHAVIYHLDFDSPLYLLIHVVALSVFIVALFILFVWVKVVAVCFLSLSRTTLNAWRNTFVNCCIVNRGGTFFVGQNSALRNTRCKHNR